MQIRKSYGLPVGEADAVCKQRYSLDFAKLTVQIDSADVMQIRKDVRATFADQLGTVGGRG